MARGEPYNRVEKWAAVPGFDGLYHASTNGRIRRVIGEGRYLMLKPFTRLKSKSSRMYRVRMTTPDGKRKEYPVLTIIAATWCPPPPGMNVVHRTGIYSDNSVDNIVFMTPSMILKKYAHRYNKKVVCRVDDNGNPVEYYSSIREAARENNLCESTVSRRCRLKMKTSDTADGNAFRYGNKGEA